MAAQIRPFSHKDEPTSQIGGLLFAEKQLDTKVTELFYN